MVSTSNPLASATAIEILRGGGNAIDAAIAAMAVLSVVETLNVGLGGDCFALYAPAGGGRIVAYNGSGRAPAAASGAWYRDRGYNAIPKAGPHPVTIPGALDAWSRLAGDHGTRPLGELLAPAISYAEDGYPVHDVIAALWSRSIDRLKRDAEASRLFLWDGLGPKAGTIHRQPDLAASLRLIAREGIDAFYKGPIGETICRYLSALGGLHTLEDFAGHQGTYVEPISLDYRGWVVHECPPNGQGIAALIMLGILQGYDLASLDPFGADRLHLAIEAGRYAIGIRDDVVGEPASGARWNTFLTSDFLNATRSRIDRNRAAMGGAQLSLPMGSDTCHVAVVDRDRNCVSMIASVFEDFGSGLVAPGTGILLQNRGHGFVTTEGHPNEIGSMKRPLHTIIPALVTKDGRVSHALGVVGGHYQAWGQAHLITNIVDYGMDIQSALDAPRVYHNGRHVEIERGFDAVVAKALAVRGHDVVSHAGNAGSWPLGGGQVVEIDSGRGALIGGADPRLDGCALGY